MKEKHIVIDPGIGFGKTVEDNLAILNHLPQFKALGFRVLLRYLTQELPTKAPQQTWTAEPAAC